MSVQEVCYICQKQRLFVKQGYDVGSRLTWSCERWLKKYRGVWVCGIDCLHKLIRRARRELRELRRAKKEGKS